MSGYETWGGGGGGLNYEFRCITCTATITISQFLMSERLPTPSFTRLESTSIFLLPLLINPDLYILLAWCLDKDYELLHGLESVTFNQDVIRQTALR